jgi:hypothetical protein
MYHETILYGNEKFSELTSTLKYVNKLIRTCGKESTEVRINKLITVKYKLRLLLKIIS